LGTQGLGMAQLIEQRTEAAMQMGRQEAKEAYTIEMMLKNLLDTVSSCAELSETIRAKLYDFAPKNDCSVKYSTAPCIESTIGLVLEKAAEVQNTLVAINTRL